MTKKCIGCGAILQSKNKNKEGYITEKKINEADYCERCFKIIHYGESSVIDKTIDLDNIIKEVNEKGYPIIYLVDILTLSKESFNILKQIKNKVYLVLTKKDLLPKSVKDKKIIKYIEDNFFKGDITVISSKKNYNIDVLYNKLKKDKVKKCYCLGLTNSGKSSLINRLLSSCGKKSYITTSPIPNTTTELININITEDITIIDTPGFINKRSIVNYIEINEYKSLIAKKEIKPKIYNIKPGFMIIIDKILRIENNSKNTFSLVFYLNNNIKYKKMRIERNNELKILNKKEGILDKDTDIVIEGLGFIKLTTKAEITAYVINTEILTKRNKMI